MKMNFAAVGIQAIQALELVKSAECDIKSAKDALTKAKGGCVHSRELLVAFVQGAAYSVQEFKSIVDELKRVNLLVPVPVGQSLEKVNALMKTNQVIAAEPTLLNGFHQLISDIRAFRS